MPEVKDRGFYLNVKGQRNGEALEGALGTERIPVRGPWPLPKDTGIAGARLVYYLDIEALSDDQLRNVASLAARGIPLSVDQIMAMFRAHGLPIDAEGAVVEYTREAGQKVDVDEDFQKMSEPFNGFSVPVLEAACEVISRADRGFSIEQMLSATGVLIERRRDGSLEAENNCGSPFCPVHGSTPEPEPDPEPVPARQPVYFVDPKDPDPALR